ncbi:hypothetical protein PILCRDRAFT_817182 [Piloderma croceum F 1598]|uniref:Uncharacterized protein n=1 Tax=Piloderma croceum (strain F 1598) TaxID=765440 RepID=A0A0C3BFZ1_PILCF|nr:hypothetical protein PILCRDRAFT_817182 [Piloderma croceum F 1598]
MACASYPLSKCSKCQLSRSKVHIAAHTITSQLRFQTVFILLFPSMSKARLEGTPQTLLRGYLQRGLSRHLHKKKHYVPAIPTS